MTSFGIKDGYVENPRPVYFLDDPKPGAAGPIVFQPDVYAMVQLLGDLVEAGCGHGALTVVDVGCGYGDKLAAIHEQRPDWQLVGLDHGDNIVHCETTYTWGEWVSVNLDVPLLTIDVPHPSIVVCADVIEHLADPRGLVAALAECDAHYIVLSTPERDVTWGAAHAGPPPNLCHIREWNAAELHDWLTIMGLNVVWHGMTRSDDQSRAMPTQLVIAEGRAR